MYSKLVQKNNPKRQLTSKQKLVKNLDASDLEIPVDLLVAPGFAPSFQDFARHCASGEPGFVASGDEEALEIPSHPRKPGFDLMPKVRGFNMFQPKKKRSDEIINSEGSPSAGVPENRETNV